MHKSTLSVLPLNLGGADFCLTVCQEESEGYGFLDGSLDHYGSIAAAAAASSSEAGGARRERSEPPAQLRLHARRPLLPLLTWSQRAGRSNPLLRRLPPCESYEFLAP